MSPAKEYWQFYGERIRKNIPGYFGEYFPFIAAVLFAAFLDYVSTVRFMLEGSVSDEFHPIIRLISILCGPFIGPLIGKLGQLAAILFLTILFRPFARFIFIPIVVIYLYAAWYNTWGITIYTPLFLRLFSGS